ncbi:MAG: PaRep2b protein [Pyrobaculum sp.]
MGLLEAGLRELGDVRDKALSALREAAEKLSRGEEAEIPAKELAEFVRKVYDIAHRLELLFEHIAENAEKRGDEEMRKAFTVTELTKELAEASKADFGELGGATIADKVVAFFESLAEGTTWSRVVLNAAERGETYGALIRAPRSALDQYGAGRERAKGEEERLSAVITRLAFWLAERGVDKAVVRRDGDTVRVVVNGETVAEVKAKAVKEEEKIVFVAWGKWVGEEGKKAAELAEKMEPSKAEEGHIYALLATDGGYEAEGEVNASTTSVVQAASYRVFGMEVSHTGVGSLTEDGLKPQLAAKLYREGGGEKVVEMIRRDLEEGLKTLLDNAKLREELREKALKLLSEMKISVQGADEETGKGKQRIEEVRKKIGERIVKFLTELRLGEKGAVCLVDCQFGESVLTYKHEPYARVIVPLVHYIASDASEEEVAKFLAYAVLFDGTVRTGEASLTLGNFRVDNYEKRLPLDMYDKIALYIILAAKYGVGIKGAYVRGGEIRLYFDAEYAAGMFSLVWAELSRLWRFGVENGLYADHILNKLEGIRKYVEEYVNKLKIEYELYSPQGVDPWVEVRFKDDRGSEVAHINIRWDQKKLHAYFRGVREKAERLASILNALGASVEAKERGGYWHVDLTTDSITAIRRKEWLEAVKALVEELHKRGIVNEERRDWLLADINAGPNVVEIAGVELSVWEKTGDKSRKLIVMYQPRSANAFDAAVKALKDAGFEEGVHIIAKRPEGGEKGYIRLRIPTGLWRLVELSRQGVDWADKALRRLEEMVRARGFSDLLEEHLKPAREAETVDPRGLVVEDAEKGVKVVIKDVRVMREGGRPRVVVEYKVNGKAKSFSFIWGVTTRGRVIAGVILAMRARRMLGHVASWRR